MFLKVYVSFLFIIAAVVQSIDDESASDNTTNLYVSKESKVLSRRKRFIVFPEGSSFQLVFCVQTSALITIGDIFLYSNTAALAWTLPSDPQIYHFLQGHEKPALRRKDEKHVTYVDDNGKVIAKIPYKRPPIISPVFAKRSVDEQTFKEKLKLKVDRMKMHEKQLNRDYLNKEHLNQKSIEYHRSSRVELFQKIERLISTLGQDGRQCVLYKLCEAAQPSPRQGTFLQEFLRAVFTLPKGPQFLQEEHKEYDQAHTITDNCSKLYPGCEDFKFNFPAW